MSIATTVEQPLLRVAPTVPWPSGTTSRNLTAVIVAQDYGYVDTLDNVPSNIRGRIPRQIKDGERLMIWKDEMGYLFGRNPRNDDVLVLIFKGALQIPVVLPSSIVVEGKPFRDLTQQTADSFGTPGAPPVAIQSHPNDRALQKFIRSYVLSISRQQADLRALGLSQSQTDELFMGSNLNRNVDTILGAILPEVKQTLEDGRFSLQNILDLRHASPSWPGNRPCIYVRIYTDPEDQPEDQPEDDSRDEIQADIDQYVGVYIGQSMQVWVRHREHERSIESYVPKGGSSHYQTAAKSLPEDRHTIPLLVFEDRSISSMLLNMAEQVMLNALRAEARWIFVATPGDAKQEKLQRRAHLASRTARTVRSQVNWPELKGRGLNASSPLFEEHGKRHIYCIPMATSGGPFARAFTTYRMRRNLYTDLESQSERHMIRIPLTKADGTLEPLSAYIPYDPEGITGLRPDIRSGYLVAEIMNDRQPHPRAYVGCPSVGPFENFHEGSCIALRYEWLEGGKWYTVYLQRHILRLKRDPSRAYSTENAIEAYRFSMKLIQAFEGTVYTEPLNGFPQSLTLGVAQRLQTDHLNQRYRWVPQQRVTRPAPAIASWEYNYKLMVKNFGNELFDEMSNEQVTFVGPSDPIKFRHGALNWSEEDFRKSNYSEFKCDSCAVIDMLTTKHAPPCTRDESRNDVWVCKHCSLFNRPCTFTPLGRLNRLAKGTSTVNGTDTSLYPKGPFRFLSFHHTMSPQEMGEIFEVSEPLVEKLGVSEDEDGEYEEDV